MSGSLKRYFIVFLICFISINVLSVYYLINKSQSELDDYLQSKLDDLKNNYQSATDIYDSFTNLIFKTDIKSEDVSQIIKGLPGANEEQLSRIRNKLFEHLSPLYNHIKEDIFVRQLHFHLPNGHSFLRMHRPQKFGDPLFSVRYSILQTKNQLKKVTGFEEGRIFNGYRYVYPLIENGVYLGSVEISVSMNALINYMKKISQLEYCFLLNKEVVSEKVFKDERKNYLSSQLSNNFLYDKEINHEFCQNSISKVIVQASMNVSTINNLQKFNAFTSVINESGETYLLTFLPIENIENKKVAYIYSITKDTIYNQFKQNLSKDILFNLVSTFTLFSFIFFFLYRSHTIKTQNSLLEKVVKQRTIELERTLDKERRYIRLLNVIKTVDDKIVTSDNIYDIFQYCVDIFTQLDTCKLSIISIGNSEQNLFYSQNCDQFGNERDKVCRDIFDLVLNYEQENYQLPQIFNNLDQIEKIQSHIKVFEKNRICKLIMLPLCDENFLKPIGNIVFFSSRTDEIDKHEIDLLEELAKTLSSTLCVYQKKQLIQQLQENKLASYKEIVLSLVDLTEQRDSYTAGHTRRVANYSLMIGKKLGLDDEQLEKLENAAILHDIGKVVTPDSILLKPGQLKQNEYHLIQNHVVVGEQLLSSISLFKELADVIKYHHERYDGSGYPYGVKGNEIPLLSRILGVADSFDAMTTNRIYKPRKSVVQAIEELQQLSGIMYDPAVIEVAIKVFADVTVDLTNSQMPDKAIDYERTSYYFKDQLTGLFNQDYLKLILNYTQPYLYRCINVISISGLHQYNKYLGWENGDNFLRLFAARLDANYPESVLFRIYGDVFIVLNEEHLDIQHSDIEKYVDPQKTEGMLLNVQTKHFDLKNEQDYRNALHFLSSHQYKNEVFEPGMLET